MTAPILNAATLDGVVAMSKAHPTAPAKPSKPHPQFPLYAHHTRRWAKKIRGQTFYFGPWEDPDAALSRYLEQRDDLLAGRTPRSTSSMVTTKHAVNHFLRHKADLRDQGEISARTWGYYKEMTDAVISKFGKRRCVRDLQPIDFMALRKWMSKRWGSTRVGNGVQTVRSIFRFCYEDGLLDSPVRFGIAFKKPSAKVIRLERAARGTRMFERVELLAMLNGRLVPGDEGPELVKPSTQLRAMFLLALNGGLGNGDCARLPISAIDFEGGWLDYPRVKTGIPRRIPLWPETLQALRGVLKERPEPKDKGNGNLVFVTRTGAVWFKDISDCPVAKETRKLLTALGIGGNRAFYSLRRVFQTVGDGALDPVATTAIMGHAAKSGDMAAIYRQSVDDERLKAVVGHVRTWLFAEGLP